MLAYNYLFGTERRHNRYGKKVARKTQAEIQKGFLRSRLAFGLGKF